MNTPRVKIFAVTFDKFLRQINQVELNSLDYTRINRMKRIEGEETIIVGCTRHFSIVEMQNKAALVETANIPNVHNSEILDFELKDRHLYSKGANESMVKVTTFGVKKEVVKPDSPKPIIYQQSKYETFKRSKIDCPFIQGIYFLTKNPSKSWQ
jgi:hypothetical protein